MIFKNIYTLLSPACKNQQDCRLSKYCIKSYIQKQNTFDEFFSSKPSSRCCYPRLTFSKVNKFQAFILNFIEMLECRVSLFCSPWKFRAHFQNMIGNMWKNGQLTLEIEKYLSFILKYGFQCDFLVNVLTWRYYCELINFILTRRASLLSNKIRINCKVI